MSQNVAHRLGEQLTSARQRRGLTQEQVAEAAGMSRNHYQLLEIGLGNRSTKAPANPRLTTLVTLAKVLDIELPVLIRAIVDES